LAPAQFWDRFIPYGVAAQSSLNRHGFSGEQRSRRISPYGTKTEEDLDTAFTHWTCHGLMPLL
jgi:hypothetical protein